MANTNGVPDIKPVQIFSVVAAQFYSASNILEWIKKTVGIELKSLQDNLIGAALCKLLQKLYPAVLPMKVYYCDSRLKSHCILNLKVFNQALETLGVKKQVSIELLDKVNFAKMLIFARWFRQFYEANNKLLHPRRVRFILENEPRVSRKEAACASVLDTRGRPRCFSAAGVSKKLDNEAVCASGRPRCFSAAGVSKKLDNAAVGDALIRNSVIRFADESEDKRSIIQRTRSSNLQNNADTAKNLGTTKVQEYERRACGGAAIKNKPVEKAMASATTDVKPTAHPQATPVNPPTVPDEKANAATQTTATLKGATQASCSGEAPVASFVQKHFSEFTLTGNNPGVRIKHIFEVENFNPAELPSKEVAGGESTAAAEKAKDACDGADVEPKKSS